MFEYDSQIALDDADYQNGILTVTFPESAILYLRSSSNTPDELKIIIKTAGGNVSYLVPTIKMSSYSVDILLEKNLLFLIPFYIFNFEKSFKKIESDVNEMEAMKKAYERIAERVDELVLHGRLTTFEKIAIQSMSRKVLDNLASKNPDIRKGVLSVMGGKVLEYEAKTIRNEGRAEGRAYIIENMLSKGYSVTKISEDTGIPLEEVRAIEEKVLVIN